jgi:mono/diheme cytochrome c family protein
MMLRRSFSAIAFCFCSLSAMAALAADADDAEGAKFYESQVQPILQAHCYNCHGADEKKVKSGFNLTTRDGLLKGGENGPGLELDKPLESELIKAINYEDLQMPPKGKLPQAQIKILTEWIKKGAPWSDKIAPVKKSGGIPVDDRARNFWSFKPVVRPQVPTAKDPHWVRNQIDAFIAAKLDTAGLSPNSPASKTTLLRRVYYDLAGLPPSVDERSAFLADQSPDAYEKVVDRLLASPQYGERWGRHWLDLVRYAETNSFEVDAPKPEVWRYRDYVIRSFNEDKPYDQFVREQLAGDEQEKVTADGIIATGYYRLGTMDDGAADKLQATFDGLDDIVATTGQVFLGMSMNCARCHDHKIDPFPTRDYYRMLAFVRGVAKPGKKELRPLDMAVDSGVTDEQIDAYKKHLKEVTDEIAQIENALEPKLEGGEKDDFKKNPGARGTIIRAHFPKDVDEKSMLRFEILEHELGELRGHEPSKLAKALWVNEGGCKPPVTHILMRGNPHNEGDEVKPGFPSVITPDDPEIPEAGEKAESSGRRKVLAEWMASPKNPLTARVMANRLWHYHFGRGIVRTMNDFGYGGTPPTHPELLDWLASELVDGGWTLKRLHKLILMSNTYQMSTLPNDTALAKDRENDLFWRFDLRRLESEELRDSILAVCGNLNPKMGGPSIYPKIADVVLAGQSRPGDGWHLSTPAEQTRRSVYVHVKRSLQVPFLAVFDSADTDISCPARFATTQPTQALAMLNSEFLNEQAKIFSENIAKEVGADVKMQVKTVLQRVMQREPTEADVDRGVSLIEKLKTTHGNSPELAFKNFCLVALNMNEFLYLN